MFECMSAVRLSTPMPHIGNARPAVVFDVLARPPARARFPRVTYARNITDVDDKIISSASAYGWAAMSSRRGSPPPITPIWRPLVSPTGYRTARDRPHPADDRDDRGVDRRGITPMRPRGMCCSTFPVARPMGVCRAPILTKCWRGHGSRWRRGSAIRATSCLWKPSDAEQPGLGQPLGARPARLAHRMLRHDPRASGRGIDIHGGGIDLRFPHHENEIAQGTKARFWVHNGHVTVSGAKMSKSLGNVLLVRDLLAEMPGEAIRYALLSAHYRQPLDWTPETPARPAPRSTVSMARCATSRRQRRGPRIWRRFSRR